MATFQKILTRVLGSAASRNCTYLRHISTTCKRCKARIIDGKAMAVELQDEIRAEVKVLVDRGRRAPHLSAILVGEDPASKTYVRNKMRAAEFTGISSETIRFDTTVTEAELLRKVTELNNNSQVDGILVQLPLPAHMSERKICNAVVPWKDIDGFHVTNVGRFCLDMKALLPCTPAGVLEMIKRSGVETFGKNAVICGRSKNVGMPIAMLLHSDGIGDTEAGDCTVTICHRYTPPEQLKAFCKMADILIVATGIPRLITGDMVKEGVAVFDVGINRIVDTKTGKTRLVGDVDFESVSEKASYITPVPGGVGPMTVAMLMRNTLLAARSDIPYDRGDSGGRKQTGRGKGGGDGKGGGKGRKEGGGMGRKGGEGRKKGRGSGGKKGRKEEPKEGRGEGRKEGETDRKGGFGRKKS